MRATDIRQWYQLSEGWKWRMVSSNGHSQAEEFLSSLTEWTPVAAFPSVVEMELLRQKIIPDPNIGENERLIQWTGHADWEYTCSFPTPEEIDTLPIADLVFQGLDTFATVSLNGKEILKSDNMFLPRRVDVKQHLKPVGSEHNNISILFESVYKKGEEIEKKHGKRPSFYRDRRRMVVRKAQYHFGWDWGPVMMTSGPYMPIYLDLQIARLEDVYITSDVSEDHQNSEVSIQVRAAGETAKAVKFDIHDKDSNLVFSETCTLDGSGSCALDAKVQNPRLWWPNGQGEAHLYTAAATLLGEREARLDTCTKKFGIRTIKVIQRPLDNAPGTTFMFSVNGRDIFAQGGNWIPADMLIPTLTRERYFNWIRLAKYNHLNMIRVWGGGIYETEDFYDACDEMGILVWQDYGFACGDYPVYDEYHDNVKAEVESQTIRLRSRASLAILCGNNEDFAISEMLGIGDKYDFHDHKGPFDDGPFPARKLYLQTFPEITKRLCPNTQYWPSSPWGEDGEGSMDLRYGDVHQWNVWHLKQMPYQKYKELAGRFVSEFGMHGFPVQRTVDHFAPNPEDRFPQSRAVDCHNKGAGAELQIPRYLAENFRYDMKFENYIYTSQLLQSEAYGYSLRDWKRKFSGKGKEECAGAIVWQFNDVYPVTSWAYVDYYLRPKPSFYTIRRNFAPISVGLDRTPRSLRTDEERQDQSVRPTFEVFAHNTSTEEVKCTLTLKGFDFKTHEFTGLEWETKDVTLSPGHNTELGDLKPHASWKEDSLIILEATLSDPSSEKTLARFVDWPEPYRYLHWPTDTTVKISMEAVDSQRNGVSSTNHGVVFENIVTLVANRAVKGCWVEPVYDGKETEDEPEPLWEDNMVDLLPGQEVKLGVTGLRGRNVRVRYLSDWEVSKAFSN